MDNSLMAATTIAIVNVNTNNSNILETSVCLQAHLCVPSAALLWLIARERTKRPLLIVNILVLHCCDAIDILFINLRYLYFAIIYASDTSAADPCALVTPIWMLMLFRMPATIHIVAFPLTHLCVMLERARATLLLNRYEREGTAYGLRSMAAIWITTTAFVAFALFYHRKDFATWAKPFAWLCFIPHLDSQILLPLLYALLLLLAVNCVGDWLLYAMNQKLHHFGQQNASFTLSQKFQLNENLATMRILLPLDACYTMFFGAHLFTTAAVRQFNTANVTTPLFYFVYDCTNLCRPTNN